jgi:hypothetical protein
MQPTRYPNPGISANEFRFATGIGDARKFPIRNDAESSSAAATPSAIEPEMRTIGEAAPQPNMTNKTDHATTTVGVRRKPAAQPREHDPTMAYGASPFFGNYRSWGSYQAWGSYRSWGNYQAPSGPQSKH